MLEQSIRPVIEWHEVGCGVESVDFRPLMGEGFKGAPTEQQLADWAEEDMAEAMQRRQRSLKKAAQRAKTMCRRVIITEGFDELLTLTYKVNQLDRELCKKHFSIWQKRMKRALGSFRFCASFEMQERGAMHAHVATHRLPKHAKYNELAPEESNRYSRSNGTPIAKPDVVRLTGCTLADAISVAFDCRSGRDVVSWRMNSFKDGCWLCTEPGAPPGLLH